MIRLRNPNLLRSKGPFIELSNRKKIKKLCLRRQPKEINWVTLDAILLNRQIVMNKKTKSDYLKTASSFINKNLIYKGIAPTTKTISQAMLYCAKDYRPASWRKLRCALVTQQSEHGFHKTAQTIKHLVNPITANDSPDSIKSQKKAKQKRRKYVTKKEHLLLKRYIENKGDSCLAAAIEIARILGCRPIEIMWMRLRSGNQVFIEGAKKTENGLRGLDRTVVLSEENHNVVLKAHLVLLDYRDTNGVTGEVLKNRLQHRLATVTKNIWPRRQHQLTLISYRHQMGSDLKGSGKTHEEVAAIMGHQSTDSVSVYGNKRRSNRQLSIKATQESIDSVRKTVPKNPNFLTQKPISKSLHKNNIQTGRILKL